MNAIDETACACQCRVVVCVFFSTPRALIGRLSLKQYHSRMFPFSSPVAKYSSVGWNAKQVKRSGETYFVNPEAKDDDDAT